MRFYLTSLLLFLAPIAQAIETQSIAANFAQKFPHISHINYEQSMLVASNGQSSFTPSGVINPESETDLINIIEYFSWLKENNYTTRPMVIAAGSRSIDGKIKSGWSFDAHAQGHEHDLVLNTAHLTGLYEEIDWRENFDQEKGIVKVWVYAGTSWRELVNLVNESYIKYNNNNNNYFVPIIAPTGSQISLGGSFASNTHARGTSVKGGYFADTVDAFRLVTLVNNRPVILTVDKEHDADLFYALIGSFGRGGIVSAIKINLQMISQDQIATTKVKKVSTREEMTTSFLADRTRLTLTNIASTSTDKNAFLATVGIISNDFKTYFMLENNLESPSQNMPSFPLYGAPDCKTLFIHKAARALPKLADFMATKFLDWHCAQTPCEFFSGDVSRIAEFHDKPLDNYIFFQDTFAHSLTNNQAHNHQTSHFTLMLRLENLPLVIKEIQKIKETPEFENIVFELQDLLPLPSTKVLMSPAYAPANNNEVFIAYSISWPVDKSTRDLSRRLQAKIVSTLNQIIINGQALAWLHPLKEFSFTQGPLEFYAASAQKLEQILNKYGIQDREIFYNKTHDYLYNTQKQQTN